MVAQVIVLVRDEHGEDSAAPELGQVVARALSQRLVANLPFDRVLIDLLAVARLVTRFQVVNGLKPELLEPALNGEHVGTIVTKD